jgi:hypothetical protein
MGVDLRVVLLGGIWQSILQRIMGVQILASLMGGQLRFTNTSNHRVRICSSGVSNKTFRVTTYSAQLRSSTSLIGRDFFFFSRLRDAIPSQTRRLVEVADASVGRPVAVLTGDSLARSYLFSPYIGTEYSNQCIIPTWAFGCAQGH